jgi:pimeloyl-ACP methyl ester carboxylesterase
MIEARREHLGWVLQESGPERAVHTVLLLPGALATAAVDRQGSLAPRFAASGVPAWVVYGESDDIGITDDEQDVLEASPHVSLVRIADAGHFTLNQQSAEIAEPVLEAVASTRPASSGNDF